MFTLSSLILALPLLASAASVSVYGRNAGHSRRAAAAGQVLREVYAHAEIQNQVNGINALVEFTGYTDGRGTYVKVTIFSGLKEPSDTGVAELGGPYAYHIHTNPIGADGNCAAALGHLDPLQLTDSLICDPAFPEYCQEGDLSGKHGKLNGTATGTIQAFGYTDNFVRFFPEPLSILGRSIVIHSANKTRLACGNIISPHDGTSTKCGKATGKNSTFVTNYPTAAFPNPPQVVTPFVGTTMPSEDTLKNMPFPLGNKALSIQQALIVNLTMTNTTTYVNGTQTQVLLPTEIKSNTLLPFGLVIY